MRLRRGVFKAATQWLLIPIVAALIRQVIFARANPVVLQAGWQPQGLRQYRSQPVAAVHPPCFALVLALPPAVARRPRPAAWPDAPDDGARAGRWPHVPADVPAAPVVPGQALRQLPLPL